jgi:hypothetical protein
MTRIRQLIAASFLTVGCGTSITNQDDTNEPAGFVQLGPNGVEQSVRIIRNVEALGELAFELHSSVRNGGPGVADIVVRTCRLSTADIEADTPIYESLALAACEPGSERISLAPGDSISLSGLLGVGAPGTYTLNVRHVLQPEFRTQAVLSIPVDSGPPDSTGG